jgi:hypothetical protein
MPACSLWHELKSLGKKHQFCPQKGAQMRMDWKKTSVLSSKRGSNEDGLEKNISLSSKRGIYEDGLGKNYSLSSKRGSNEDGLEKNISLSSKRGSNEDGKKLQFVLKKGTI